MGTTQPSGLELDTQGKGNIFITKQQKIKNALLSGQILTTFTANLLGNTVNSRKLISKIRKEGLPIKDAWKQTAAGDRFKCYFIDIEFLRKLYK